LTRNDVLCSYVAGHAIFPNARSWLSPRITQSSTTASVFSQGRVKPRRLNSTSTCVPGSDLSGRAANVMAVEIRYGLKQAWGMNADLAEPVQCIEHLSTLRNERRQVVEKGEKVRFFYAAWLKRIVVFALALALGACATAVARISTANLRH
jgi:hypothetical protein